MTNPTVFGVKIQIFTAILAILVVLLILLVLFISHKLNVLLHNYETLMSGKRGISLEKIIRTRFREMDMVKVNAKKLTRAQKKVTGSLHSCFSKYSLIRYDAFEEMAGKLSFVIALLNHDNTGIILNAMHSREGCFTYAKEIIKGESYIPLSKEEKEALEAARTVEEEINELADTTDSTSFTEEDLNLDK